MVEGRAATPFVSERCEKENDAAGDRHMTEDAGEAKGIAPIRFTATRMVAVGEGLLSGLFRVPLPPPKGQRQSRHVGANAKQSGKKGKTNDANGEEGNISKVKTEERARVTQHQIPGL